MRVLRDWRGSRGTGEGIRMTYEKLNMCVNLEGVAGSRGPGEGIRMAYEKSNMYVNLEGVAGTKILRINFFFGPNYVF